MRHEYRSREEISRVIAERKTAAARSRAAGRRDDVESSRDVYLECCAAVSERFAEDGFRFAKSGPHMSRRSGRFRFLVSFSTTYHNIPGEYVQVGLYARAESRSLKKWRDEQQRAGRSDGWIAGGISNAFVDEAMPVHWNVADRDTRDETCDEIAAYIRANLVAWFALFDDVDGLIDRLSLEHVPAFAWIHLSDPIEFAMCFGSTEHAVRIFHRLIRERQIDMAEVHELIAAFRRDGLPRAFSMKYADQAARIAVMHGLPLP